MAKVVLQNIHKTFGRVPVINNCSLECRDGEFLTLLGPSGCGKTTLLRTIAGFISPDKGDIYFDDRRVNDVPPNQRDTAMVFQSYALFPHMTVWDNVAFGPRMKRMPRRKIAERVEWALELVGLRGLEDRYPRMLSGGQQQRVALARALVMEPKVLPPGRAPEQPGRKVAGKDAARDKETAAETGNYHHLCHPRSNRSPGHLGPDRHFKSGLCPAGRKARRGLQAAQLQICGRFYWPGQFIRGKVTAVDERGYCILATPIGTLKVNAPPGKVKPGMKLLAYVRPEDITLLSDRPGTDCALENRFTARIAFQTYLGNMMDYHLDINGNTLRCQKNNGIKYGANETVDIYLPPERCGVVM